MTCRNCGCSTKALLVNIEKDRLTASEMAVKKLTRQKEQDVLRQEQAVASERVAGEQLQHKPIGQFDDSGSVKVDSPDSYASGLPTNQLHEEETAS